MSGATRIASLLAALIGTITLAFADDVDLDAQIADAKHAATAASKAAETICYNAGYAMSQRDQGLPNNAGEQSKKCTDAMQASNDASGFVGYLYERRSHLTGQPMPSEYAAINFGSLRKHACKWEAPRKHGATGGSYRCATTAASLSAEWV
jgi:hypothetical protein